MGIKHKSGRPISRKSIYRIDPRSVLYGALKWRIWKSRIGQDGVNDRHEIFLSVNASPARSE